MSEKRRILITGGRGYLSTLLISRLLSDYDNVELVVEIDPKNNYTWKYRDDKVIHISGNLLDESLNLVKLLNDYRIDTVVHTAWAFNPRRDHKEQWELDIEGTRRAFVSALGSTNVEHFVYLGSTTAYGQFPRETKLLKEEEYKSWTKCDGHTFNPREYQYSVDKSIVDEHFQRWTGRDGDLMNIFWIRGAIVLGPSIPLNNVVADMAQTFGPIMFRVAGYAPPMQFISEFDMTEILYRATMEKWSGALNVSGDGPVHYSEIVKLLGKKEIVLPQWILRPVCGLLWKFKLIPFPPNILNLIVYPWLGDNTKLKTVYGYIPRDSSSDAVLQLAKRLHRF